MEGLSKEEVNWIQQQGDQQVVDQNVRFARLYEIDLSSYVVTQIKGIHENVNFFDYSSDDRQFAISISPTPKMDNINCCSRLAIINRDGSING